MESACVCEAEKRWKRVKCGMLSRYVESSVPRKKDVALVNYISFLYLYLIIFAFCQDLSK